MYFKDGEKRCIRRASFLTSCFLHVSSILGKQKSPLVALIALFCHVKIHEQ